MSLTHTIAWHRPIEAHKVIEREPYCVSISPSIGIWQDSDDKLPLLCCYVGGDYVGLARGKDNARTLYGKTVRCLDLALAKEYARVPR